MIHSMTGFALSAREFSYGTVNVELKTVNHRYLEVQFRLSDELRALEGPLRDIIAGRVSRGKVDCRVGYTPKAALVQLTPLNLEVLAQLGRHSAEVRRVLPDVAPMNVANVLNYPGVLSEQTISTERLATDAGEVLLAAISDLEHTRAREGAKLRDFMLERIERCSALATQVAPRIPEIVVAYQERLAARIREAGLALDDDRLRQEVVLFSSKVDVQEELSRLVAHLSEVRNVLERGGQVGKRLDFLMQELNREANTLGSKSVSTDVSRASVELKVLIEQMREQVQNIE